MEVARYNGIRPRVTSTTRSCSNQRRLYERYRRGESIYPAAPPGRSLHNIGMAFDVAGTPEELRALGHWWESLGFFWGGRVNDPIHFAVARRLPPGEWCLT